MRDALLIVGIVGAALLLASRQSRAAVIGSIAQTPDGHQIDFSQINTASAFTPLTYVPSNTTDAGPGDTTSTDQIPSIDLSGMGAEDWGSPEVQTNTAFDWGAWANETEPAAGAQIDWVATDGPDWSYSMPAPLTVTQDQAQLNIAAALAAIRYAEGTATQPDPYRVTFGYHYIIRSFADHPYFTGEWQGAAFGANNWSTAAGAYQFIRKTWVYLKQYLNLPDFSPASQDKAAIELIRERGALDDVMAGRFDIAVPKMALIWASLPGSPYGQSTRTLQEVQTAYVNNGGIVNA